MSEEQNQSKQAQDQYSDPPKRKRMPSQYASQIADFKSNYSSNYKKARPNKTPEVQQQPHPQVRSTSIRPLVCLLPSGKQLSLKIVVGSGKTGKIEKVEKRKTKISTQSPPPAAKIKEQKPKEVSVSFFDKFLSVVQEIQKKTQVEPKDLKDSSKQNEEIRRRSEKNIREREQKWTKCSERWKTLSEKLEKLTQNYIYLN